MVKLIVGGTGSGKTKTIIELVNAAVKEEKGSVVCITNGEKLTFDISHDARLVDLSDYAVKGFDGLLGFLCGIHAGNYDITQVFIDDLYKTVGLNEGAEEFLSALDKFAEAHSVKFTISISQKNDAPIAEGMKKYL